MPERDIIIVDDASDIEYCKSDYRFEERAGIPRAKNKCISLFMETNAEHLFLLDDDTMPIHKDAFSRYIESGLNHACYTFYKPIKNKENYRVFNLVNGCAMYYNRKVFETVGGFDTTFFSAYEHVEFTRRIYNAGLTPERFIDIFSDGLFYCMDQDPKTHKRSFSNIEKSKLLKEGRSHFYKTYNSSAYIPYI
ncbi:MAG TPA: hypothetical protein VNR38_00935 [Ureibacillus sp.]|nr:hypothetical protein [Ureibacillus sp.]